MVRSVIALVVAVGLFAFGPAVSAQNRYNCSDFVYQQDAQAVLVADLTDPNGLDGPPGPAFDGIQNVACETLPDDPNRSVTRPGNSLVDVQPPTTSPTGSPTPTATPRTGLPATGATDVPLGLVLAAGVALLGAGVALRRRQV